MKQALTFTLFIFLFSCAKEADVSERPSIRVDAKVVSTSDMNCHLPVLEFLEDSAEVRAFTGKNWLRFVARGFPQSLNIQNQEVTVEIAALISGEGGPCKTIGPSFPEIKVLSAQAR